MVIWDIFVRCGRAGILLRTTKGNTDVSCPVTQTYQTSYVRMLFIDYSSVFNTIVPTKLITKLRSLGLNTSL